MFVLPLNLTAAYSAGPPVQITVTVTDSSPTPQTVRVVVFTPPPFDPPAAVRQQIKDRLISLRRELAVTGQLQGVVPPTPPDLSAIDGLTATVP